MAVSPGLALLRECQDRVLGREGIPMVLALVSEVGDVPPPADAGDGPRIAERLTELARELAPSGRDGDLGRFINVVQAVSYDDFGRGGALL